MQKMEWLKKKLTPEERLGILHRSKKNIDREIKKWENIRNGKGVSMDQKIYEALNSLSAEDLEGVKKEVSELIKQKKSENKEAAAEAFHNEVSIGDEVAFVFKNEEVFGKVVKVNQKSFTAEFEWEGDVVKKPIQFHKYVGHTEEAGEELQEEVV